jgi:hypothetical protein
MCLRLILPSIILNQSCLASYTLWRLAFELTHTAHINFKHPPKTSEQPHASIHSMPHQGRRIYRRCLFSFVRGFLTFPNDGRMSTRSHHADCRAIPRPVSRLQSPSPSKASAVVLHLQLHCVWFSLPISDLSCFGLAKTNFSLIFTLSLSLF